MQMQQHPNNMVNRIPSRQSLANQQHRPPSSQPQPDDDGLEDFNSDDMAEDPIFDNNQLRQSNEGNIQYGDNSRPSDEQEEGKGEEEDDVFPLENQVPPVNLNPPS